MGIISTEYLGRLSPVFKGKSGQKLADFFLHLTAVDKVNALYDRSSHCSGADFAASILEDLKVNYILGNPERLKQLPEGAFITISNHPYGALDGVILIDLFGHLRADYKYMVNQFLALIKTMSEHFITVTPTGNKKKDITAASLKGVRETLSHLKENHPVGFFPSGAVSDFSLREMRIRDRQWQESIIRLIQIARVPIVPIRFFDINSPFFYSLGLINWRIRLLRLPHEVFNKSNKDLRLGIGEIISVEEQKQYRDCKSFREFLRNAVYQMPLPASFAPKILVR
ncbi:MAG: 1-acyl-sn-glycerol-3-phosphate acyltransferase [Bacteroides sp.]|jgi:putative hemolysin|nr:1-acyl-sn-glycerol-3-phosphate acyltransferase [Bacteroides sp.]